MKKGYIVKRKQWMSTQIGKDFSWLLYRMSLEMAESESHR